MRAPKPARPPGVSPEAWRQLTNYDRGLADGRVGAMRAHGPLDYHRGYDDGLDQYDAE